MGADNGDVQLGGSGLFVYQMRLDRVRLDTMHFDFRRPASVAGIEVPRVAHADPPAR